MKTPRDQDAPLHENVRWLSSALGRVIEHFEGKEVFEAVEELRVRCRARRHEEKNANSLGELLAPCRWAAARARFACGPSIYTIFPAYQYGNERQRKSLR